MPVWAAVAAVYGGTLAMAGLVQPIRHRLLTISACLAYTLLALAFGTLAPAPATSLVAPAVLLLCGYWLSGRFFRAPQQWLETWLVESDARLFESLGVDRALRRAPLWLLNALEASYASVYVVIATGAVAAAVSGVEALDRFWAVVLLAELGCYVWLPWLRSRPPRVIEAAGVMAQRAPALRQWNGALLTRASVQANTLPSGHVAGAVAAGLAVLTISASLAIGLLAAAVAIAIAAIAGRYHYGVDCVAGALVALLAWSAV